MSTYYASLVALLLPGCLCGHEISGDAGFDSGIHLDAGPDGGDAGADAGDSGQNDGDAGVDCSSKCTIGAVAYCAYQLDPSGSCSQCVPTESSTDWSSAPIGTPCTILHVPQGGHPIGACFLPPVGSEECTCAVSGSRCWASTSCCFGVCQDAGDTAGCLGDVGSFCNASSPCYRGKCCFGPDGGAGVCSSDGGTCPG
jgi:hypothetical protein